MPKKVVFNRKTKASHSLVSKVRSIERRMSQNRLQPKYIDQYDAEEAFSAAAIPRGLSLGIDEGDTDSTRNGEMVRLYHLNMKFILYPYIVGTGAVTYPLWTYRILVFFDKNTQPAGSPPTVAQLLDLATITDPIMANKNWDNRHRFQIIYDKIKVTPPFVGTTVAPGVSNTTTDKTIWTTITISKKLNIKLKYNDATGGNLGMNMLYYLIIGNVTAATNTNQPAYQQSSRLLFQDV